MKLFKILFAALIFAGFATTSFAQDNESQEQTAEASAFILAELELIKDTDINFGSVSRGTSPNLDPTDGEATDGAGLDGSTTSIGKFTLNGEGDANIDVSWTNDDLTGPGDAITYTPEVSMGETDGDNGGSTISEGDHTIGTEGTSYFWIGGTIDVAADQDAGTYDGDFTLTVEYN